MSDTTVHPVDAAYAAMMTANSATPYASAEYERTARVFEATIMVFAQGDVEYAAALSEAFHDSGSPLSWYTRMSRDEFVRCFRA